MFSWLFSKLVISIVFIAWGPGGPRGKNGEKQKKLAFFGPGGVPMAPGGPWEHFCAISAPNGATATHLVGWLVFGSFLVDFGRQDGAELTQKTIQKSISTS